MNGKQLKNSILQWAIQGKLVPQDPNDEPASVLLDKIRQEKERLIKEKKIKRDKNASIIYRGEDNSYYEKLLATGEVKCIDEEVPFEVPTSWSWARLTHITYLIEDCPHSTAKDEGKGYPLVRTPNVGFGHLLLNDVHRVSEKVYNQRNTRAVPQKNDLIFAREAPAGNIAVINEEKVCLGQRTVLLRPITHCILPQYLAYYILAPSSQQNLIEKSSGTTVAHVNLSDFRSYMIAVPPIEEQNRIVNKVMDLLPLIEKYSSFDVELARINDEIRNRLKKSVLQEAIQGRLIPQIEEEGIAQELLEQINAEKQRLVKEGKLKKSALKDSVIFKGDDNKYYEQIGKKCLDITDEIPFVIPETWQWVRIRDVFQLNPKNEAEDEKLVAFIPMEKISASYKSDFTFDTTKWGTIKKGFTHFANGDVAFAKITPCFQNRKSAIFHDLPNGIG
uniref:restriction endonuclease subunit S n=1 Tax=Prevotella sp. TaxID=59823 RepID=UPI0027E395F4